MKSPLLASNISPGVKLFELLSKYLMRKNVSDGVLKSADAFFNEEGQLTAIINERIISYTIRRLIHGARFRFEELQDQGFEFDSVSKNLEVIREFILSTTSLAVEDELVDQLSVLIDAVITGSPKPVAAKRRKNVINKLFDEGIRSCYICGIDLDPLLDGDDLSPELEHLFPRNFGGLNDESNFQISCAKCNRQKDNSIGPFDFYFEHISTRHIESHKSFKRSLFLDRML